ncbi:MAG TPA: sulfatase-like hydrolase/transferase [Vicinamibacterales bacterium]|nr:sulfatase-like hydrolase/transferase [Vicinamibacterales bacterium]
MPRACFLLPLLLIAGNAAAQPQAQNRPNVVLIITDDVGYGDIGSYGAPDVKTPNIDSLAKAGTRLTDFYAAPNCSPTRAMLISGRYQQRYRIENPLGAARTAGEQGLPATGRTLPRLLKNNGYRTGLVGKWHLGYKPEFSPNAHGFDYFFGFKSGLIDYYQHTDSTGEHDLFENAAPTHVTGYSTDLFAERSVKFIEENAGGPFFLEVAFNAAHWPFQVPDQPSVAPNNARFVQPQDDPTNTRKDYVAILERADQGIGKILATLDRLGLARNTLVIYTQDNGGEWLSRNAPLFHRKSTVWEGGIRVPAIFRWPGRIPAGKSSSQVGIMMDLTATILAVTNSPVPAEAKLEGTNLFPLLQDGAQRTDRTLFWRITGQARRQRAVRQGDWKLLLDGGNPMLFNLAADVGERNDLASQRLDVVRRLFPLITQWELDVDTESGVANEATAGRGQPAGGRGRGQPAGGRGQ